MSSVPSVDTRTAQKVYRLALYGRRKSGKTCILAALAMARIAHPEGLSCDWIEQPFGLRRPPGDPSRWTADDPAAPYFRGKDWLECAIRFLKAGKLPEANPNWAVDLRFVYQFSSPDERRYVVELTDYSGELIDPKLSENDLAGRLRQHLLEMDGILVLAEAPRPGEPLDGLYEELERLRLAFVQLRDRKKHGPMPQTPIALLVNKWDRWTQLHRFNSQDAAREIEAFLGSDPEPPHRSLALALGGGEEHENFHTFAVSAFGQHVNQAEQADRPAQVNPLPASGLEVPLVWACRRRDEIDLRHHEEAGTRLRWWKLWQLFGSSAGREVKRGSRQLQSRFPRRSREHQRVTRQHGSAVKSALARMVFAALLLVTGVFAGEAVWDGVAYREVQATLDNQEAEGDRLTQAEAWLEDYSKAPAWRHTVHCLFLSRDDATDQVRAFRQQQEDLAWEEVERHRHDPVKQLPFASDMLARFPNCDRAADLRAIVEATDRKKQEWRDFASNCDELLSKGSLLLVAQKLVECKPETPELTELKKDFASRFLSICKARLQVHVKNRDWQRGYAEHKGLMDDRYVKALLPAEMLQSLEKLDSSVRQAHDRELYAAVQKSRSAEAIKRYLQQAPLGRLKKEVAAYRDYLNKMAGEMELTLKLERIEWGNCYNYENDVNVTVDGKDVITALKVKSLKHTQSDNVGSGRFKAKLNDSIGVSASIRITNRLVALRNNGKGEVEIQVRDLVGKVKTIPLNKYNNKLVLKIDPSGLPRQPPLPDWRE